MNPKESSNNDSVSCLKKLLNLDAWQLILNSMFFLNHALRDLVLVAMGLWVVLYFQRRKIEPALRIVLIALSVYFIGLMAAYFLTPFDLKWHLQTSVDRTTLVLVTGFIVVIYSLMESLEDKT